MLGELEPAFAVTVHKAQGSEYRAVILAGFSLCVIYDVNSDGEQNQLQALADCYITRWADPASWSPPLP